MSEEQDGQLTPGDSEGPENTEETVDPASPGLVTPAASPDGATASEGFWEKLVGVFLSQRLLVLCATALVCLWGVYVAPFAWQTGFERDPVPVDAIPDIGENQQIVFVDWPGRSPQDMENQVTYPLTVALMGVPRVKTIRSFSMFGFSSLYVIFEEGADFYWARSRLVEKLASLPENTLPQGVRAQLGPDATALGQVFWYTLEGRDAQGRPAGGWDPQELRTLQDYHVRYALAAADGVAEVASIGGFVREYQVEVDPMALRAYGLGMEEVGMAIGAAHAEVGAETLEQNGVEYLVRGQGFLRAPQDIASALIMREGDTPVTVGDVARVNMGPGLRRGALTKGGAEAVGGVVTARYGANPREVIENVQAAMAEVAQSLPSRTLPDGTVSKVTIVPFYDRSVLIDATLGTLNLALYQQILITVLVVLVMMVHLRSSLLVAVLLPIAVLATFVAMKYTGVDANVVALAGIAIAIGTMVDVGIIMTENIVQHLGEARAREGDGFDRLQAVRRGAGEVAPAILTAILTTVVSFLPVFLLEGQEGKLFAPLAWTKTFALLASLVVAIALLPLLAWFALGEHGQRWIGPLAGRLGVGEGQKERGARLFGRLAMGVNVLVVAVVALWLAESWEPMGAGAGDLRNLGFVALVVGGLLGIFWVFRLAYVPLLRLVLAHKAAFLALPLALVAMGLTAWLGFSAVFGWLPRPVHESPVGQWMHHAFPGLSREFMPFLDEGTFLYMPSTMPHASIGEAVDLVAKLDQLIATVPEVEYSVGKLGRAETPLDPAPISMFETIIQYRPEYDTNAQGERKTFRTDAEGQVVRDPKGELVEDPDGQPHRNWRPHIRTPEDIWNEIVQVASQLPGMTTAPLLQPISTRVVMLQSGIRAPMAVRLRGPNLEDLADAGVQIERLLRAHPLVQSHSVNADRPVGKPYLEIVPDRTELARQGVSMQLVQQTLEAAVGGMAVAQTIEGRERYMVRMRYPRELRDSPEAIAALTIMGPEGAAIPLGQLAQVRYVQGPEMIRSEDTYLVNYVMFAGKPEFGEVDVVESTRARLEQAVNTGELQLAEGVSFGFAGSYENSVRASQRFAIIIPLVLGVILMLIYLQFRSTLTALMIFSGVAVAFSGGFALLWLYGQPWFLDVAVMGVNLREVFQIVPAKLSVAVWVGFIALFGIATDDGVVMATYLHQRVADRRAELTSIEAIRERVVEAGSRRIRPCLMTTATTILALLPVLTSYGTGADVMIPMALPAVGGMAIELFTLFIVPVLFASAEEGRLMLAQWWSKGPQAH